MAVPGTPLGAAGKQIEPLRAPALRAAMAPWPGTLPALSPPLRAFVFGLLCLSPVSLGISRLGYWNCVRIKAAPRHAVVPPVLSSCTLEGGRTGNAT